MLGRRWIALGAAVLCLSACAKSSGVGSVGVGSVGVDSVADEGRHQPVSQVSEASCARAADQQIRLVGAQLRLHTLDDPKESPTRLQFLLVVGGHTAAGVLTGAGHEWPQDATVGPLPVPLIASVASGRPGVSSAPTRADVLATGRVELSSTSLAGGAATDTAAPTASAISPVSPQPSDEWHLGWRLQLHWSNGTSDVLAAPTAAPADRADYVRLLSDRDGTRFGACASLVSAQRWDTDDWFVGAGTARAMFFEQPGFHGLHLTQQAEGSSSSAGGISLGELGRHCGVNNGADDPVAGCSESWDDVITSVSTTGAGQRAAAVLVSDDPDWSSCLLIPAYRRIPDLSTIVVRDPEGKERQANWARRISAVRVSSGEPSDAGCERFVRSATS